MPPLKFTPASVLRAPLPVLAALAMGVLWLAGVAAIAQTPASEDTAEESTLRLRKIYVPAGEVSKWPTEGKTYLPIETDQLAELLELASRSAPASPRVLSTVLHATTDPAGVLQGTGHLRIESPDTGEAWLAFPESNGRIAQAWWDSPPGTAQLGYRGGGGGLSLRVPRSGQLELEWELAPHTPQGDYELHFPPSLATLLVLDLAEGEIPQVEVDARVLVIPPGESSSADSAEWSDAVPPPVAGRERWVLVASPGAPLAWQMRRPGRGETSPQHTMEYSAASHYQVAENGTRLSYRLRLEGEDPTGKGLVLDAPRDLVVTDIKWGKQSVAWSRHLSDGAYSVAIDSLPSPTDSPTSSESSDPSPGEPSPVSSSTGTGQVELVVEAWCPTPLGEYWQIPQLELRDGFWLHETLSLAIVPALELRDMTHSHLRLATLSGGEGTRSVTFHKLRSTGRLRIELARRTANPCVRIGRYIELDGIAATASVRSVLECDQQGDVIHLQGEVLPGWNIQSVLTRSAHRVEDWYLSKDPAGRSILTLRATVDAAAPTRNEPLEIDIEAHRSVSPNGGWQSISDHLVLRWSQVDTLAQYISFGAAGPYQVDFLGTPRPIPERLLDPIVGPLLPSDVTGDVFDLDAMSDAARVNLAQPPVEYDAAVTIDVWDEAPRWRRECRVQIDPRQGLVDELPLVLPGLGGQTLRWRLASQSEWRELLPQGPVNAEVDHARRTLVLSQPMAASFDLVIDLGEATSTQLAVAPIQLPGARRHSTRVQVHSPEPTGLMVEPSDFVMEPLLPSGESMGVHSIWRLTSRDGRAPLEVPSLRLRREAPEALPPRAQVERATLTSQYAGAGSSHHRYELSVMNQGESQLECSVPEGAQNVRWWGPATSDQGREYPKNNQFAIPLPRGVERPVFLVEFTLPRQGLGSARKLRAPWPSVSLPVIRGEWLVEVPTSYLLTGDPLQHAHPRWRERLLGVFARQGEPATAADSAAATRSYRVESPAQGPIELRVTNHERRVAWCLFLAAVAVVVSPVVLGRWFSVGLVAAGLLTVATLLLPWGWSLYVSALNAGLWLGIAIHTLRAVAPRSTTRQVVGEPPSQSVSLLQVTSGLLLVLALLLCSPAAAAPAATEGSESIEAVLIPLDDEGRPASDQQFVTPRLLRMLLERRDAQQAAESWMLTSATYEAELLPSTGSARLQSGVWTLSYGVEVFRRGATIELPLVRGEAAWEETASVDGIATPLAWNGDGHGCRFTIGEPGRYQVKLRCTPVVTLGDQTAGLALRLPPLGGAELRLKAPTARNEIRVDGAPLPSSLGMGSLYRVKLAMRPVVRIQWPASPSLSPANEIQASERSWMHVTPQGIELESVFHLRGNGSLPDQLRLEANVPAQRLDGETARSDDAAPAWQRSWDVRTEPSPIGSEGRTVRMRLRLPPTVVWGRVRFPQFQLEGVTTLERQFAASATEAIVLSLDTDTVGSSPVDPEEFLADWPEETLPQIAVQQGTQAPWPVVVVAPYRDDLSPDETLQVCGFADRLEVAYEGEFPRAQSQRLLQTLRVSPELQIERVEVVQNNQPQEVRYTRPQPDRLVVWLDSPMERSFRLEVAGKVDASDAGTTELPQISTWSHPPTSQRLLVYSARDLAAELVDDQAVASSDPPSTVPSRWDAYAVGSYQVTTLGTAPLALRLAPNPLRYDAQMLTAMLPTQEGWVAEVAIVANVTEGKLSQLELDLPSALAERIQIDAPGSASLDRSSAPRVRIVLGKVATAGEQVETRLRVAVRPNAAGEVQVPELRLRGAAQLDRYVSMVPGGIHSGVWVHRGATAVEPPEGLQSLVDTWPEALVYRVTHNSPVAVRWIPRRPVRELASLGLMEVHVEYTLGGGCLVRTRLTLPPSASQHAVVRLKGEETLLAISVDGAAAVVEQAGEQSFLVRLPEGELPRGVEVVARLSQQVQRGGEVRLEPVEVAIDDRPLAAERVLWWVVDRSGATATQSTSAASLPALDGAAIRLTHLLDASSGHSAALASALPRTQRAWASHWHMLLADAQSQLAAAIEAHSQTSPGMVDVADATSEFDELLQRSVERMKVLAEMLPVGELPSDPTWSRYEPGAWEEKSSRFVMAGSAGPLAITVAPRSEADTQQRWGGALVVLLLTVGIALVAPRIGGVALRDPLFFAVVLVLGVAWWLWAPLRWAGFIMALGAIVAWMRWSRRYRPR